MENRDIYYIISVLKQIEDSQNHGVAVGSAKTLISWINTYHAPQAEVTRLQIMPCPNNFGFKINAIKEVRSHTGFGLKEAKDLVELGGLTPEMSMDRVMELQKVLKGYGITTLIPGPAANVLFGK